MSRILTIRCKLSSFVNSCYDLRGGRTSGLLLEMVAHSVPEHGSTFSRIGNSNASLSNDEL